MDVSGSDGIRNATDVIVRDMAIKENKIDAKFGSAGESLSPRIRYASLTSRFF